MGHLMKIISLNLGKPVAAIFFKFRIIGVAFCGLSSRVLIHWQPFFFGTGFVVIFLVLMHIVTSGKVLGYFRVIEAK